MEETAKQNVQKKLSHFPQDVNKSGTNCEEHSSEVCLL